MQETGDSEHALLTLTKCLSLAELEGYVRIFLDEGQPMKILLAQWLASASVSTLRDYAVRLLSQFDTKPHMVSATQEKPHRSVIPRQARDRLWSSH